MISIIVAIAKNFAIGKNNDLLYHLPNDLKHFKTITSGHTVLMGLNTFRSLPKRPLPNRRNLVIAFPNEIPADKEGAEWFTSPEAAIASCDENEEILSLVGHTFTNRCTQ